MTDASECAEFPSNTFIQDVFFNRSVVQSNLSYSYLIIFLGSITGTSSGSTGASLACSPDGRCDDINLNNITVTLVSSDSFYVVETPRLIIQRVSIGPQHHRTRHLPAKM